MNTTKNNISTFSKILLIMSGTALAVSIFVPLWEIQLAAPQYPEGLNLLIYPNKLGGNVDIINGLNHYIGMKTLHTEDFIEFKVLPYIIGFFALLSFITAFAFRKKGIYILFSVFVLFGIVAMYDFWRWEYDYGHNLNPDAAIIVPGMAYQPPLIGYKQLLNFGAYSIPSYGGWLFIFAGLLMLIAVLIESGLLNRNKKKQIRAVSIILFLSIFGSCSPKPEPIKLNVDNCSHCQMTIADNRFAAELITKKGRIYKFDDTGCMINYIKKNSDLPCQGFYISDYLTPNNLVSVDLATLINGENVASPMGGNIAAFSNKDSAQSYSAKFNATIVKWDSILK